MGFRSALMSNEAHHHLTPAQRPRRSYPFLDRLAEAEHSTQEDNQAGLAEDAVIKVCAVIKLAGQTANKQVEMPMPMLIHI